MKLMTTSQAGRDLIKKHEGLRLKAYKCPAGVWTVGYGHTRGVTSSTEISQSMADLFLLDDIRPLERYINKLGINFRQGQFDAIVSFLFNLGEGNFNKSTLKKKILAGGNDEDIAAEFKKWNKAGGKVLDGLTKRREEEAEMWFR
jgi:lysozyme